MLQLRQQTGSIGTLLCADRDFEQPLRIAAMLQRYIAKSLASELFQLRFHRGERLWRIWREETIVDFEIHLVRSELDPWQRGVRLEQLTGLQRRAKYTAETIRERTIQRLLARVGQALPSVE